MPNQKSFCSNIATKINSLKQFEFVRKNTETAEENCLYSKLSFMFQNFNLNRHTHTNIRVLIGKVYNPNLAVQKSFQVYSSNFSLSTKLKMNCENIRVYAETSLSRRVMCKLIKVILSIYHFSICGSVCRHR